MDDINLKIMAENEKEWRQYMIKKVDHLTLKIDHIDKELSTFKIRVFSLASVIGGAAGYSVDYVKHLFTGG